MFNYLNQIVFRPASRRQFKQILKQWQSLFIIECHKSFDFPDAQRASLFLVDTQMLWNDKVLGENYGIVDGSKIKVKRRATVRIF